MPNITDVLRARGIGVGRKRTGDAVQANVLAGKIFSNKDNADLVGTMPYKGPAGTGALPSNNRHYEAPESTVGTASGDGINRVYLRPQTGYYEGDVWLTAKAPDLRPENIKPGKTILGITGNFTNDAVLDPYWLTEGYSGYDDGALKYGTSPRRGQYTQAANFADPGDGKVYVRIPEGTYRDKTSTGYPEVTVNDAWLRWTGDVENDDNNVLQGKRYWAYGVKRTGTMPNRGFKDIAPSVNDQWFPWGYYDDGGHGNGFVVRGSQRYYFYSGIGNSTWQGHILQANPIHTMVPMFIAIHASADPFSDIIIYYNSYDNDPYNTSISYYGSKLNSSVHGDFWNFSGWQITTGTTNTDHFYTVFCRMYD